METITLSGLTTFIRRVFALNLPEPVWLTAELAQVGSSRGHTWLTLVEKSESDDSIIAQMDAVIWEGVRKKIQKAHGAKILKGVLQEGMSVRLRVTASFHERYGLKLVVEDVDPDHTMGALEKRRQTILAALAKDHLLDRNARIDLPPVLQRLAVISSETAAGLADFRRQLKENPYGYVFKQELYPAAMQGRQTAEEILTRLRQITRRSAEYDAVVIVRGGGGKTDLAAFDDEGLCRTVSGVPLPVLTGIGHEIDETILDRVVHRSLKTPTAVAAFLVDHTLQAELKVLQLGSSLELSARNTFFAHQERLQRFAQDIHQTARYSIQSSHLRTTALKERLYNLAENGIASSRAAMDHHESLLKALHPETTLARGYALVSQDGRLVTSANDLRVGEVEVRLRDGKVRLQKEP